MLFEKFADDYARLRPAYPDDLTQSLIDRFRLNTDSRILDLACGTGNLGRQLKQACGSTVLGLDRSLVLLGDTAAGSPAVYCIPEPATIALLGFGGLSLLRIRRKR